MTLTIRPAERDDAGLVLGFIRALADYEKLLHEVVATEPDIIRDLFCDNPRVSCDIAEWNGEPAGFALWFYNYSTFRGTHGIYLEDLFVGPKFRGKGIGKGLLKHLAKRCVSENLGNFQWWVLNWNEPSIDFYKSLGAVPQDEWTVMRIFGEPLQRLAEAP